LETIPIGKPLPNERIFILSEESELKPIGVPGELCIGGLGLARGYLNQPELTANKFIKNPYSSVITTGPSPMTHLLYRTGDLVKWLPDGNIEFIGRIDHQVKVRGYRIEMGEIEYRLLKHGEIKEALVTVTEKNGENRLCAYIVSDSDLTVPALREYLTRDLPEQMIPEYFIRLDKMPLKPNGKIDRKALDFYGTKLGTGIEYVEPENETEKTVATIWKDILNLDRISVNDSFFEIGGNSLTIVAVNSRLKKTVEKDIPLADMFRFPTIKTLARFLDTGETTDRSLPPQTHRVEAEQRGKEKLKDLKRRVRD
jgi:acyl carrier protein